MNTTPLVRERLLDRMIEPPMPPITLVTAPAGYGKSTLAAQWAERFPGPVASITMMAESNTLPHGLRQVIQALESAAPGVPAPAIDEPVADHLFNYANAILEHTGTLGIVIDDYHQIHNPDIHDTLNRLLIRPQPGIHVLLLSRTMPELSLGRLHAHGHIRHLTEADLRFTPDEVATFTRHFPLSRDGARQLAERTEGWIAGIRLALLSISLNEGSPEERLNQFLATFHQNQWLDDYIVEEVLDRLPADLREFVLQTSILEILTPDLCNAMLERDDSARLLNALMQRIVFVSRTSEGLTYHRLFAECVNRISQRSIAPAVRRHHHLRAARWLEEQNDPVRALRHALRIRDRGMIERLATTICVPLSNSNQLSSLLFWLNKVPPGIRRASHQLSFWYMRALLGTGQLRRAELEFSHVRSLWEHSDDPLHRAQFAIVDGSFAVFTGDNDRVLHTRYEALKHLPPDAVGERFQSLSTLHQFEFLRGNDTAADAAYRQAIALKPHTPPGDNGWFLHLEMDRANHRALRADLVAAEEIYSHQLAELPQSLHHHETKYRSRRAVIYLEWNELGRAMAEANLVLEGIRSQPYQYWYAEALLFIARVQWAAGYQKEAEATFRMIIDIYESHGGRNTMLRAEAMQAMYWLLTDRIHLIRDWVSRRSLPDHPFERIYGERDLRLPRLALYVADERWDEADALIRDAITDATSKRHKPAVLEFSVWRAIVAQGKEDPRTGHDALRTAIRIGTPGRFVRSFFPVGHDLRPLLREIRPTLPAAEAAWVDRLIRHAPLPPEECPLPAADGAIPTPLTPSEERVLGLLNEGLSNRQIAEQIFVTERTVKKHVSNILAKLDVTNRTAAVTRAHEVGLL